MTHLKTLLHTDLCSPGLVASSRALNQPLIMFWRVLYHQWCTQQSHVLKVTNYVMTHLVSQTVRTTKSCFDASCITRSAHTKVTFWLAGIVLYHQCTAHSKLMPQVICTFVRKSKIVSVTHACFMLAHRQQGLFVFVPRQSFKSDHRKTDLIQKCLYSVFLSFLSFIKLRNTIRDEVSPALYTIKTLLTLFKLFKLLQH